ncbi:DNA polymerase III delta prime subunit [Acidovorax soli]|uniref:DNA polymerase III delta prime subunit n=1 Tax=Acidovorax soli TaxID=592050 RepID=A0A7X0U8D9_9BURK|nr:AAA domain-containing protein [Acidovorax soli]MBB6558868.1 DNA polymerase III delta prime subunit [Acidovorax soli]
MIRFCPNCKTERPLTELFCEGTLSGSSCEWSLSDEPIRNEGWRPTVITTETEQTPVQPAVDQHCVNGHAMAEDDFICLSCGADRVASAPPSAAPVPPTEEVQLQNTTSSIEGWRLIRQLSSTPRVRDRYIAQHEGSGDTGVLTLYHHGAEPDTAVYEVLRRLPHDHVPRLLATGRWDDRAYEVSEELTGGALSDLGIVATDLEAIRHIVSEVGKALHAFSEVGLRHRDIRPATLLVRNRDPLDLVVGAFGSARLSEFDLDIVSPLEVTRYMAPEVVAGGVAAASDWWSLGMVLLEQVTKGACFEGINDHAFLIHVLANGVPLPEDLPPSLDLLFRGLLARDRLKRWQWEQARAWLNDEPVEAEPRESAVGANENSAASLDLNGRRHRMPGQFALAAAEASNWDQARDHLVRGAIATSAQEASVQPRQLAALRQITQNDAIDDDFKLMLALKVLNAEMPLIHRGHIVTPRWLLDHPLEGYELISGTIPTFLERLDTESWILRLKTRSEAVRRRAKNLSIEIDEDSLRIYVLTTSKAKLAAAWEERRRLFPDTPHSGLQSIAEKSAISEEDLIVLLSATLGSMTSLEQVIGESRQLAAQAGLRTFNEEDASAHALLPRLELSHRLNERIAGFATCPYPILNEWAEDFRIERRIALPRALALMSVPAAEWAAPQKQQYISQILEFFEKRVAGAVLRGPLVRMTIGTSTARVDLHELGTARAPAAAMLDHLLLRNQQSVSVDPAAFGGEGSTEYRLQSLARHTTLYRRDTGIDGLYLGFPFLLAQDGRASTRTRIAPVLLWPIQLKHEVGSRGIASLAFDGDREEVRLNPALEAILGPEKAKQWRQAAEELLSRSAFDAADVMDMFGQLSDPRSRALRALPRPSTSLTARTTALECSAVLFHVTFMGQAIGEDLRNLKGFSPAGTGLETALRLRSNGKPEEQQAVVPQGQHRELDRFFTVSSDPSQEAAVLQARNGPGLLIEGPPGTGKSQTIVNIVGDAIGRQKSLLIVCQKHAALEVVQKRLVAEGLGDRIVMVNDVNSDRGPIIKAVREQLEALHRRGADPLVSVRRKREDTAARIESLEGELDRHHTALHRVDEQTGLSYRTLLGELIALETPEAPLDIPALRTPLQSLSTGALAALEEEIAPIARLWLPARYEGSALSSLLPFAADKATQADFMESFGKFQQAEKLRTEVLLTRPSAFEVEDPGPHRTWLAAYGQQFLDLPDFQRGLLAKWLPLFRPDGTNTRGGRLIAELQDVSAQLKSIASLHHDKTLSKQLSKVTDAEITTLINNGTEATSPAAWWQIFNLGRHMRKSQVQKYLKAQGEATSNQRIEELVRAAQLELQWRPLRLRLSKLHQELQLPAIAPDAGPSLLSDSGATLQVVTKVAELAKHLAAAPWADKLDAAALQASRDAILKMYASFDAAFARFEVRMASAQALKGLVSWMEDTWIKSCGEAIARNEPNQARLETISNALPSLAHYQLFRGRAQRLSPVAMSTLGLLRTKEQLLDAMHPTLLEREVRRLLNREARLGWKRRLEQADPDLHLEHAEIDIKVASLAALDQEMRALNRQLLKDDFDVANIRPVADWEDITRLTGQRARRLREFIELGAPLGLMKLRPIWLMNPDVASRVLPLKAALFDSVIYDEASQMPVEHALPTLFRGGVSIVSGDEKQMPPTAFFSSKVESDEAEAFDGEMPNEDASEEERDAFEETWNRREIKDCPDLLQLSRSNLPNSTLQIHYRSAYRELIGYSNACFYGNHLSVPVRHPEATVRQARPIEVIQVNTVYQDQTNPGEAQRVVEVLAELWKQPALERPSVGVVTFNRKQADLVEDLLEQRAELDPEFREAYRQESERVEAGEDMGVFVKNVENVQGDERDIIVFSSTFGRNSQGTFRRSFGVLGQKGGERRLNVAVTRARRKIILITSMPVPEVSDLLNTHRPPSTPRDFLQGYLEYARSVSSAEFNSSRALLQRMMVRRDGRAAQQAQSSEDGFSESVAEFIAGLGWRVVKSPDQDAFGLDFAIEDPQTGLFAIGIECDAPRHGLLASARAREVWRPSVLRRAIPKLHRVSSYAWYHAPEDERQRLREAIESVLKTKEAA